MIAILTTAVAWIAGRGRQLVTGNGAIALAICAAVVAVLVAVGSGLWVLRADAANAAVASWRASAAVASQQAVDHQRELDEKAAEAADVERRKMLADLAAARARTADLEQAIASVKDGSGDVLLPEAIFRNLSK
jgi:hypothetical protein